MVPVHLPFWSFFHAMEKTLSYERWIDKYKLFLEALLRKDIRYDKDYAQFIQFCKILYLQDHRDEQRFEQLLLKAIDQEKEWLRVHLRAAMEAENKPEAATDRGDRRSSPAEEKNNSGARQEQQQKDTTQEDSEAALEAEVPSGDSQLLYYNPSFDHLSMAPGPGIAPEGPVDFLFTDEYYPASRRQMVKGWQFLRRQEKGGKGYEVDLPATIERIGKDGLFLEPIFKPGMRNREDTIIIFADYRGSMVAFHEMTDRLIATAQGEGGHPMAPVYYFQNYPAGYVYKHSNLTGPVKIRQALAKANKNFTLAIVISDGGAARTSLDPEGGIKRAERTDFLLKHLRDTCARTIWLNPMPLHRWAGTAAEHIRKKVFLMAPLLEQDSYKFQDIMRTILKHRFQIETGIA